MWERFSYYGMRAFLILYMTAPAAAGGLGFPDAQRCVDLRHLHRQRLGRVDPRRARRRSRARPVPQRARSAGIIIAARTLHAGLQGAALFLHRPRADRARHRPAQAERQHARRVALRRRATRAATPASRSSTWGSISARSSDRSSPAIWRSEWTGTSASPAPASAWRSASIQYVLGREAAGARRFIACRRQRRAAPRQPRHPARAPSTAGSPPRNGSGWRAIVIFFVAAVLFWGAYEQAGSTLNLFADRYTRLDVLGFSFPSSWFQSVQPVFVDPARAGLRLAVAAPRPTRAVGAGEVRHRPAVHEPGVPGARARGRDGAERDRHAGSARGGWSPSYGIAEVGELCLSPVGLSAVTKPGAAPHRRPDDGRVVPLERVREQARRMGRRLLQRDAAPAAFTTSPASCRHGASVMFALVKPIRRLMGASPIEHAMALEKYKAET